MQPIAGYSNGHNLAGGRPSAAKTGTVQLGDTGATKEANKDAWMVGYTPSLSTAVWVGTVRGQCAAGNRFGCRGLRFGAAVGHLEVDDGQRAEGHLERDLPQADRDRWLRRGAGSAAAATPAAACRDGHPAHCRNRAGHHHPGRSTHHGYRWAAAAARRRHRRRPVARPLPKRHRDRGPAAGRHHLTAATGRRSAERRQPGLPQPQRLFGRRSGGRRRRTGGPARVDRPRPDDDPAAGDVFDRAGIPGARLVNQGGLPAEHRHRAGRSTGCQLG